MTKSNSVPGPWWIEENFDRPYVGHHIVSELGCVAETCTVDETEVSADETANAHLMAAAPELLEALTALVNCPGITWLDGYKAEMDEAMRQAHAAIAKATGGAQR